MKVHIITRCGIPYRVYEDKERAHLKLRELIEFNKNEDVTYDVIKMKVQ